MKYIYNIIRADYLQRSRSYAFLIYIAVALYAAHSFVPPLSASYTTLNVPGFRGAYNSAYVGYVSSIMTTVLLSLYGFFMIHGGIKKDIDTEVGLIIATTPITNFEYLLSKMFSNLLVLLSIASCAFIVNIIMFLVRSNGTPFIFIHFIVPFLLFVIPSMFLTSSLAVISEVFLGRRIILQYVVFFFLFGVIMTNINAQGNETIATIFDPFGLRIITSSIRDLINNQFHANVTHVGFGFISDKKRAFQTFYWNGIGITNLLLFSRVMWMFVPIGLIYLSSFFFHRFNFKPAVAAKKKSASDVTVTTTEDMHLTGLPALVNNFGIFPFIKTELILLVRKGSGWMWLISIGLSVSMLFAPIVSAHLYILPALWFLQVTRLSELTTREITYGLHYITFASYKPLQRMLPAQMLAGIILTIVLALPLLVRYLMVLNGYAIIEIINGAVFIVLLTACLGILTGSKKVFEIIFFLLTYIIIQAVPEFDYLGAVKHGMHVVYISAVAGLNVLLFMISVLLRRYQLRHF